VNETFTRRYSTSRRQELARLALGLAALAILSGIWHASRPFLIRALARSSLGLPARDPLLAAAVTDLYPQFPVKLGEPGAFVAAFRLPESAYVVWQPAAETAVLAPFVTRYRPGPCVLADRDLKYLGRIRTNAYGWRGSAVPGRAGTCDVAIDVPVTRDDSPLRWWAVVRLCPAANRIIGAVQVDRSRLQAQKAYAWPVWRDEDHDGRHELVIELRRLQRGPSGLFAWQPPETVAAFATDGPGELLSTRRLPDDGIFALWTPPDGQPLAFSLEEYLDDVVQRNLPAQGLFGGPATRGVLPPDTQPANLGPP
jgi:hypothetical protein